MDAWESHSSRSESPRYTVWVNLSLKLNSFNQKVNSERLQSQEGAPICCLVPEPSHNETESVCLFNFASEPREVDCVGFGRC